MPNIEVSMGFLKSPKLDLECLSSHISVTPIFKHILIELECWNFRWGLGAPFCLRLFRFYSNTVPLLHSGPPNFFCPPPPPRVKFFIYCVILMKFETHFHMFTNNNGDINLWIGAPLPPVSPPSLKKSISSFTSRFLWNLPGGSLFINFYLNYYW